MSLSFEGIVFIIISKGCTVELEFLKTLMLCIGEVSNSKKESLSTPTGKELSLVIQHGINCFVPFFLFI